MVRRFEGSRVRWVAAVVVLLASAAAAGAQTVAGGRDVCASAWFHDEAAREEFARLSNTLEKTDRHREAVRTDAEATQALLTRLTASGSGALLEERAVVERTARDAWRSPELAGVQAELTRYCLQRMRRAPRSFTDAMLTHAARSRRLAALPDNRLAVAFRTDTDQFRRELSTPEAAARTIRTVLASAR